MNDPLPTAGATTADPVVENPYVGPRSFTAGEQLYGREREITDVSDMLLAQRIVLLYSPSGAGKSSLLEAGLRCQLGALDFRVPPTIRVGHEPPPTFDGLAVENRYTLSALLSLEEARPPEMELAPRELCGMSFVDYLDHVGDVPAATEADQDKDPCLFFDQFEELFTLDPTDVDQKAAFLEDIGIALRDRRRWALFAMREDFIAQLDPYVALLPTRLASRYRLDLLGVDAARMAIRRPAERVGVAFSLEAANHLLDDLRRVRVQRAGQIVEELGPYVEPVQLQVVCSQLWRSLTP